MNDCRVGCVRAVLLKCVFDDFEFLTLPTVGNLYLAALLHTYSYIVASWIYLGFTKKR